MGNSLPYFKDVVIFQNDPISPALAGKSKEIIKLNRLELIIFFLWHFDVFPLLASQYRGILTPHLGGSILVSHFK